MPDFHGFEQVIWISGGSDEKIFESGHSIAEIISYTVGIVILYTVGIMILYTTEIILVTKTPTREVPNTLNRDGLAISFTHQQDFVGRVAK